MCVHVVPLGDVSMGYIEFQHVICQFPLFLNPIGKSVAPHKTQNMGCRYLDTHCSSVLVYAMFKTVATDVILCGIFLFDIISEYIVSYLSVSGLFEA